VDYGEIVRRAFEISWRHRFLWLLALLAGEGSTGVSFNYRVPTGSIGGSGGLGGSGRSGGSGESGPYGGSPPDFQPFLNWVSGHLALLVGAAAALAVLFLVLLVLSVIAEGAVVRAVGRLDGGEPATLGSSWREGVGLFWPMLGLRLLAFAAGVVVLAVVASLLGLALFAGLAAHAAALAVLLGWQWLGLLAVLFPVAVAAPTILQLAARALALDGAGPWASLVSALRLVRRRIGPVAALWAIQLVASLAVGVATLVLGVMLFVPLLAGGYVSARSGSIGAVSLVIIAAAVAVLAFVVIGAAVSAFFSSYWTIGYRRLRATTAQA
jgi:hypothetical protein